MRNDFNRTMITANLSFSKKRKKNITDYTRWQRVAGCKHTDDNLSKKVFFEYLG